MPDTEQSLVLLSKLQPPQIKTHTLRRRRLIDHLSENLHKKLILLCAGAGYGKTTLLSQFISSKKIPYIYYHLERSDREPAVFFAYLIAGIRKFAPDFGKKVEKLRNFFNHPQHYLDIIVGTFINEIIEHIKDDFYIILEDYHSLHSADLIDGILAYLLDHLPAHLHFVITTRTAPVFPLSGLRARGEIYELDNEQLRFTKEEIRRLFEQGHDVSFSIKESELNWVAEHSEGWPTSLRLMLQSSDYMKGIRTRGYLKRIMESYYRSQSNLFNYFAQEIFSQETKEIKRFLVDCSLFEWLTPGLCKAVTGSRRSAEILDDLTTRNVFVFDIPGVGYRIHHLFREFLISKLNDVEREKRIYERAARYYTRKNLLEEAIKYYLFAEDFNKAASIIERLGSEFIAQGRSSILLSYIEKIPKSIRIRRALLLMYYAQALTLSDSGRLDDARDSCLLAVKLLKTKKTGRKKYADALYRLGGIVLNQGKYNAAKRWFKEALRVCPQSSSLTRASILNSIGSIYNAVGGKNIHLAEPYFKKALKIVQRGKYRDLEASILNNWAQTKMKMGDLSDAYAKHAKMVELLKHYYSPGCGAGFYNAARTSLLLGYQKEARSILDAGIKMTSAYNDLLSMARIWEGYAMVYQATGDQKKALQLGTKALEIYEKLGIVYLIISALREMVNIYMMSFEYAEAERVLASLWEIKGSRHEPGSVDLLITEAHLRQAQNKIADAEDILLGAVKLAERFHQYLNLFYIYSDLSKVYHAEARDEKMIAALEKTVTISREKGYDYLLCRNLQKEKWMLPVLHKAGIQKRYLAAVLTKTNIDMHWMQATLFGVPSVSIDNNEIADTVWRTVKSKKLFFYLLAHKNEKVSQDALIDALWHDATSKSGSDSLRKAVQHIRQIFGRQITKKGELIISGKGMYSLSPNISYQLDIEDFQNIVNKCKMSHQQNDDCEHDLKKAIAMHKKGFAVGWYDTWVEDMRTYYKGLYEECMAMLVDLLQEKKKYKEAVTWCRKLIGIDYYNEAYHRKLMKAYAAVGRHKELVRAYRDLEQVLHKEFSAQPQQETVDLFNTMTHS